eukprot:c24621_g1_i1 orf=419-1558(+)
MASIVYMDHGSRQRLIARESLSKNLKDNDERFKKGEWSDDAIKALLDAYELKWNLRNRGNLRVGDWEEVARHVCTRGDGIKSSKTPTQCKNKIEGMKKKYRSEVLESCNNPTGCSGWSFFARMDSLLRCPTRMAGIPGGLDAGGQPVVADVGLLETVPPMESGDSDQPGLGREALFSSENHTKEVPFSHLQLLQGNHDLRGKCFFPEEEEEEEELQDVESNHENASNTMPPKESGTPESDISTPVNKGVRVSGANLKSTAKQRKQISNEVAASIKTFADSILKLEQAKMELYKDTERLRAEAEARRAELELRRTEIIMNTQLQIAKLLSKKPRKKNKIMNRAVNPANLDSKTADFEALVQLTNQQAFGYAETEPPVKQY